MENPTLIDINKKVFFEKVGEMYPHYDFSEFQYTGVRIKSIIICQLHGPFLAHRSSLYAAKNHVCPECRKQNGRLTVKEFFDRIKKIHSNKYSYNENELLNASWTDLISIQCQIHGEFFQGKGSHISGSGCPKCYRDKLSDKSKKGIIEFYKNEENRRFEEFIHNAISKFGDRYDYSESIYTNSYTKIKITCPDHGTFYQTPYRHLQSSTGCLVCSESKLGLDYVKAYSNSIIGSDMGVFYKLLFTHKSTGIKFIKIGITSKTIEERFSKGYEDFTFEIMDQIEDTNLTCATKEATFKNRNAHKRFYIPTHIKFSGRTECYVYDEVQQLRHSAISFLRDSLLEKQNGVCAICQNIPIRPVLDHDHSKRVKGSSYCRGTICSQCNILLAKMENNAVRYGFSQEELPNILRKLAAYKRSEQTNFIHPSERPKAPRLTKLSYNRLKKFYEGKSAFPEYPKTGKLTVKLKQLFDQYRIKPEFYAN